MVVVCLPMPNDEVLGFARLARWMGVTGHMA
jgi:hypothetical protein